MKRISIAEQTLQKQIQKIEGQIKALQLDKDILSDRINTMYTLRGQIEEPDAPAPSPFLPGTKVQYAWIKEKADWLLQNGVRNGDCLECHLAVNAKGYSPIGFGRAIKMRAHRVVFLACNPTMDQQLLVLHKCDNRRCIEPSHLFSGTARDNTQDMMAKGRNSNGDGTKERLLKVNTAKRIRSLMGQGLTNIEIARRLHVSATTVSNYISTKGIYHDYL